MHYKLLTVFSIVISVSLLDAEIGKLNRRRRATILISDPWFIMKKNNFMEGVADVIVDRKWNEFSKQKVC